MRALVLAGGDIRVTDDLRETAARADLVVAADSGLRHAEPLGVTPALVVGDFDSVTKEVLAGYPDVPRKAHPPEKDRLDLELALHHVLDAGADEVIIIGGLGGRLDQTLAAVLIAAKLTRAGARVWLHSGDVRTFFLSGEDGLELPLPVGQRFSVLSLSEISVVTLKNAKYPLTRFALPFGLGRGVSNEVSGTPLEVALEAGLIVVTVG